MILITGATGYVGGRLVTALLQRGTRVRCLARSASRLQRPGWESVEVIEGDARDPETQVRAMSGVSTAFYLIHSMKTSDKNFAKHDVELAQMFARVASDCQVGRIVYLGGLGDSSGKLSEHLESRHATGDALRTGKVPVIEFRAGIVLGSGSLSFELLREMVERLPLMVGPRWVNTKTQPIAIRDVLAYLIGAHEQRIAEHRVYEVGGADVMTYADLMQLYAKLRNLKRYMVSVPFLTPHLSSYWVDFITSVPASVSRPLIESLRYETVSADNRALADFPVRPMGVEEAMRLAIARVVSGTVETRWSDSFSALGQSVPPNLAMMQIEGMIIEHRFRAVDLPSEVVFQAATRIGGDYGWPYADFLWELRGQLDRLVGGVGMRRGRRSHADLRVGDPLDFWRVDKLVPGKMLRLHAEMKVPGKAWLQFEVREHNESSCTIEQTTFFEPRGLLGLLYWYSLYPIHKVIFTGMIRRIVMRAHRSSRLEATTG